MTVIEEFDWVVTRTRRGESKYEQWLDGRIHKLIVGKDIPSVGTAQSQLRRRCYKQNLLLRSRVVDDGKALVVQAQGV
jgi:hypothetical protein